MGLGLDEGSIGMDTLSVSFEIVKSRESSTTVVVRANMGFGSKGVVSLDVGLEVESSGKASTANTTPVSLLGIIRGLAGNISTSTTIEVGEGNVGG